MISGLLALLLAPAAAASFPAVERSTEPIAVVYPAEGAALGPTDGEFIMGSVSDPEGVLTVNGATVAVHKAGGFLAWVPVVPGTFTFQLALTLPDKTSFYLERRAAVAAPSAPLPAKPVAIDRDSLWPRADLELRGGDWLETRMKASPGQPARFRVGKGPWRPMAETNPGLGLYEGAFQVPPGAEAEPAAVRFEAGAGWSKASAESAGRVSFSAASPAVAAVRGNGFQLLKAAPGEGELFPILGGARVIVTGRQGAESRVQLSAGLSGWIETRLLEFLPPGSPPPQAVTDVVSIKASESGASIRVGLTERVPFQISEAADLSGVTVRIHHAVAHTNWMVYDSSDSLVGEVRLKQETADSVLLTARVAPGQTLWGYHAAYEGSSLRLELRRAPRLAPAPASPLAGRTVFLDPGHMPSSPGAVAPLGTREMDVNLAIAKAVEALLLRERAVPVLSRRGPDDEVGLSDRPRMAWERKADLFVSIHNNQLAGGRNPYTRPYGFSVFYYHPHSLPLAREVYRAFERRLPLEGEQLRFGDLLVARMTQMPAVLTESAYMTFPEQEQLLLEPAFREKVAQGIVSGLRAFLDGVRARQGPPVRTAARPPAPEAPEPAAVVPPPAPKRSQTPARRRARSRKPARTEEPT